MYRIIRSAAVLALFAYSCCDICVAADLPYDSVVSSEFPDPAAWDNPLQQAETFPDWNEEAIQSLGYRELKTYYYGSRGLVTARAAEAAWLSIFYYSTDGNCYLALPLGRIAPRQQISYSIELPAAEDGLTRVVLWRQAPAAAQIEELAAAARPGLAWPGVMHQAWFPRTNQQESGLPYEPVQFRVYETPPVFAMTDIPSARIQLSTDYMYYAKDAYVEFDGRLGIGMDDWGSRGEWVLSWGNSLRMEVYLPERRVFTNAILRLYMEQSLLYSGSDSEGLMLVVNGRSIHSSLQSGAISVYPKHVDYELGQYMYPGVNVIELSMDAFSTQDWLLQTAEVWIR